LNRQRIKAIDEYQNSVEKSIAEHDQRITDLETKKSETAQTIIKKHKDDLRRK
jgi:prefoldin subunit 5